MRAPAVSRLPAAERRQALVETAMQLFSEHSYHGTTTAEIARKAGVSEPILYRHFASKRELYFACLDATWTELREAWTRALAAAETPADRVGAIGRTALALRERKVLPPNLWIQALSEAGDDPEIRKYLRRHMREVHDFVADVVAETQAEGGIPTDRDPSPEAWIFIACGLLLSVGARLGGLVSEEDFAGIAASRQRWLSGI